MPGSLRGSPALRAGLLLQLAALALLVFVLRRLELGGEALGRVSLVVLVGFPLHALAPSRLRTPLFVLLSLAALPAALGPRAAAWVAGAGLALVFLARLPLPVAGRVAVLVPVAAALAAARSGWLPVPVPEAAWAILASLFMFRLIVYLRDVADEGSEPPLGTTLGYFFLLPNACLPLFPVVDFTTFRERVDDGERLAVSATGLVWMVRGAAHLLVYRLVHRHLLLHPAEVATATDLARYLAANLLLYVQVSGLFHLATGILRLFGYRLPATHRWYLLSPSVNEFWRRANIYWRDFMLKVVYYPAFFALRRLGNRAALAAATGLVFVATWFLHGYQWFWLRGTWRLGWQDAAFWGGMGALVLAGVALRSRRRSAALAAIRRGPLARGLATLGTLVAVSVLWSLWTAGSPAEWLLLWRVAPPTAAEIGRLLLLAALVVGAGAVAGRRAGRREPPAEAAGGAAGEGARLPLPAAAALLLLVLLAAAPGAAPRWWAGLAEPLSLADLSPRDLDRLEDGYYEPLSGLGRVRPGAWAALEERPSERDGWRSFAGRREVDDVRRWLFAPGLQTTFKGERLTTNRWGLRDDEVAEEKPPGTRRVAVLGASSVVGSGVADDEVFTELVEERWARRRSPGPRLEVLNFAVPDHGPFACREQLARLALRFSPDVVLYFATRRDTRLAKHLVVELERGTRLPRGLAELVEASGLEAGMSRDEAVERFRPWLDEALADAYRGMVELSRSAGARPVWIYLPHPVSPVERRGRLAPLARAAGFEVAELGDPYAGFSGELLRVGPWDGHPNELAHRLVAERLSAYLESLPELAAAKGDSGRPQ